MRLEHRLRVFDIETCIQALDKIPGETIVDPRAIVFAKGDPGLALRIPDHVLLAVPRAGDEESIVTMGSWGSLLVSGTASKGSVTS